MNKTNVQFDDNIGIKNIEYNLRLNNKYHNAIIENDLNDDDLCLKFSNLSNKNFARKETENISLSNLNEHSTNINETKHNLKIQKSIKNDSIENLYINQVKTFTKRENRESNFLNLSLCSITFLSETSQSIDNYLINDLKNKKNENYNEKEVINFNDNNLNDYLSQKISYLSINEFENETIKNSSYEESDLSNINEFNDENNENEINKVKVFITKTNIFKEKKINNKLVFHLLSHQKSGSKISKKYKIKRGVSLESIKKLLKNNRNSKNRFFKKS